MAFNKKEYMKEWKKNNKEKIKKYNQKLGAKQKKKEWEEKNPNYNKKYYLRNKEKLLKQAKEYRKNHKKEIEIGGEKWRDKNPNYYKKYNKNYYQKNKEKIKENIKDYASNNKQKIKEYQREYGLKNKDNQEFKFKRTKIQNKYRKKHPEIIKAQNLANQKISLKPCCEICGSIGNLERHHWNYDKPLLVNTLCRYCHQVQHIKNI